MCLHHHDGHQELVHHMGFFCPVFSIILMGYALEIISDNGDDEEDENVRMDATVRTVKEWSVRKEWGDEEEWADSSLCGFRVVCRRFAHAFRFESVLFAL
jgi:hypothetical protein